MTTPTKEELKRLLDVLSEFEWDTADLDLVESYTEGPHYPKLHGLVRLALSALEPKGQALPDMWSEEDFRLAAHEGFPTAAADHIRALQRHILSAKAVEWRKIREKLQEIKVRASDNGYDRGDSAVESLADECLALLVCELAPKEVSCYSCMNQSIEDGKPSECSKHEGAAQ